MAVKGKRKLKCFLFLFFCLGGFSGCRVVKVVSKKEKEKKECYNDCWISKDINKYHISEKIESA